MDFSSVFIVLIVLKCIGILITLASFTYFLYIGYTNRICAKRDSICNQVVFFDAMYYSLLVFCLLKGLLWSFEVLEMISIKVSPSPAVAWTSFAVSVCYSVLFLMGLWLFSYRYLVTSIELNHLFTSVSQATLKRYDLYEKLFWAGCITVLVMGPFKYSDFTKLRGANLIQNHIGFNVFIGVSAMANGILQLAIVLVTTVSLYKINKFIRLYPEMKINKTSTVIHYILLLSLAVINTVVIVTINISFSRNTILNIVTFYELDCMLVI